MDSRDTAVLVPAQDMDLHKVSMGDILKAPGMDRLQASTEAIHPKATGNRTAAAIRRKDMVSHMVVVAWVAAGGRVVVVWAPVVWRWVLEVVFWVVHSLQMPSMTVSRMPTKTATRTVQTTVVVGTTEEVNEWSRCERANCTQMVVLCI